MIQKVVSIYVKLAVFTYSLLCVHRFGEEGNGMLLQLAIPPNESECKPAI